MTIGKNLLSLRKAKGISQEELANELHVSRQTVSQWETDQTMPTVENFLRLKEIFGVPVDKMLNVEDAKDFPINSDSLDTICAALAYAIDVEAPACAAEMNRELVNYIDKVFDGEKVDRIVMYNPDAIAEWIYQKYPEYLQITKDNTDVEIFLSSVMPSVTPVCFGTMYTGAQPSVHGIQKYEKPVITIDTLFDALLRAGKKPAIVSLCCRFVSTEHPCKLFAYLLPGHILGAQHSEYLRLAGFSPDNNRRLVRCDVNSVFGPRYHALFQHLRDCLANSAALYIRLSRGTFIKQLLAGETERCDI